MNGVSQSDREALPSTRSLLKATGIAIAIAAVVLVTAVLPAEYGIDPTGIGARLGLNSLSAGGTASAPAPAETVAEPAPSPRAVWRSPIPYRTDEMSLELPPGKGAEIKAAMQKGDRFVFSWTVDGGAADYDMHGEKLAAKQDEFTSYLKGSARKSGHGAFEAPFDGTHGWYWQNRGKQPITVRVRTSGFYEKLSRP